MTREDLLESKAVLQWLLKRREGVQGYSANVQAIKDELVKVEQELGKTDG